MNTTKTPFFHQISPDVYRENPFRITGLPVDATSRDIRRRSEELKVRAKLGTTAPTATPLALDPPPDIDAVQQAIQRLRDPVRRLEDELFWFWPSGTDDPALNALRTGDVSEAERLWTDPGPGRPAAVAAHNLAVLAHARALDADDHALWEQALRNWRTALDTEPFWDLVAARARTADDPRVGPRAATELRERLPAALLSISANLAVQESQAGEPEKASAHLALMHSSGFAAALIDDTLREAIAPEASHLRSLSQTALERANATSADGYAEATRLLDRAEPVLSGFTAILPDDHTTLLGLRDEIADSAMRCTVLFINETSEWTRAEGPLLRAESVAASPNVKSRITDNLTIVRDNKVYDTCWFCHGAKPDKLVVHKTKMYGDVQRVYPRITWKRLTINVPRCTPCASAHRTRGAKVWAYGSGIALAIFGLALILLLTGSTAQGIVLMILDAITSLITLGIISNTNGLPPAAHRSLKEFPPITEQFQAGWRYGDGPPNVQ
ncbi:hypothetical protein GCM10022254_36200 [Actinomadura meridiana]|uniref:Uncharacterized protein n=1 Tax=Actinomadura meridiana TaxID=559626 RepID=A0ABP8C4I0_9ACTN